MAKAASPIRLQQDLMQAAVLTGKRFHRSTAEQIEYWAEIGRKVAGILDADDLLSISMGLAKIKVEPVHGEPVNPDEVFQALEDERAKGILTRTVSNNSIQYQASLSHPGYLEQVDQNGDITLGKFQNGEFIAIIKRAS